MFQLYKTRNFNAIFNDTFGFFKATGKNYFKNYFIINGPLILILLVLGFIFFKVFFENMFSGAMYGESPESIEGYFSENFSMMVGLGILTGILGLIAMIVNYSYPVFYLMAMERNEKPDTKEILNLLKSRVWKAIVFGLLSLVTFFPLFALICIVAFFLSIIIIGFPVAVILVAAFLCWMYQSFYDYLTTDNGFLTSMETGYHMLTRAFWAHSGSTAIFFVFLYIVQIAMMVVGMIINMLFGLVSAGPDLENGNPEAMMQTMSVTMIIGFVIQTTVSFVMGNFIFINQGIIYYSGREQDENKSIYNDIDLIGRDVE